MTRELKARLRAVARSTVVAAVSALCWTAVVLVAPTAHADRLSNGLELGCFLDSVTNRVKCATLPSCPRVNGDYVVDALHVLINGKQDEYPYKCINGATAKWFLPIDPSTTFTFGVQACRKKDFEGDWCTPYADYTYTPPLPVQCPSDSPTKTVPAGQKCAPAPPVVLEVTPGEPIGGTPKPAVQSPPAGHTVISDVDLYDVPGGGGKVIGKLKAGDPVTLNGPCPIQNAANPDDANNGWCEVTATTRSLTGAAWGELISK